jgi:hypothetical protein
MAAIHYSPIIVNLMLVQLYVLNLMHGGGPFLIVITYVLMGLSALAILFRLLRLFTIKRVVIICQFTLGVMLMLQISYLIIVCHDQMKRADMKLAVIGLVECAMIIASFIIEMKFITRKKQK